MVRVTASPRVLQKVEGAEKAQLPNTGAVGHHVCEQNVDTGLQLGRAGADGKQESLGPGGTPEATH